MQTVDKAIELLGFFSERRAQAGLSELARLAGFDKATTRRLLLALGKHGLIEQNPDDRRYRLGPGVLRLARVRESTSPLASSAAPLLQKLVDGTGETAHLTVLAGNRLSTIAVEESRRSNRVTIEIGERLPLHATASGIIALAYGDPGLIEDVQSGVMQAYTGKTPAGIAELTDLMRDARDQGFLINDGWYESDVCSIAAPFFDPYQRLCGTIAVAAPAARFAAQQQSAIGALVVDAGADMTARIGGRPPASLVA